MEPWLEIRPIPEIEGVSRREAEGAAWRAIVRERLGQESAIAYNENGAPVLEEGCGYIGVSHTKGWVAVVWSPEPCAVDIEPADRKLSPAAAERYSISTISEWCALEARYKYASVTGHEPAPSQVRFHPHPDLVVAVIIKDGRQKNGTQRYECKECHKKQQAG